MSQRFQISDRPDVKNVIDEIPANSSAHHWASSVQADAEAPGLKVHKRAVVIHDSALSSDLVDGGSRIIALTMPVPELPQIEEGLIDEALIELTDAGF